MRFMLDTNLCIDLIRGRARGAFERLQTLAHDEAGISTITLAELQYGASKSHRRQDHLVKIAMFCAPLCIAAFDDGAAETYGGLRAELETVGTPIGPLDTLIAAHALARNATILTANTREFRRVKGLDVQNWKDL